MPDETKKPSWWLGVPDIRLLIVAGYFAMAWRLLYMIEGQPSLLKDAAFMTIATLIIGTGGLGAISTFYFGGTKTGSDVMKSQSEAVIHSGPPTLPVDPPSADPQPKDPQP